MKFKDFAKLVQALYGTGLFNDFDTAVKIYDIESTATDICDIRINLVTGNIVFGD